MVITEVNEETLCVSLGEDIQVKYIKTIVQLKNQIHILFGVQSVVSGYNNLYVQYDLMNTSFDILKKSIDDMILEEHLNVFKRTVVIPVCYEGFGEDLYEVAKYHNITIQEVIELHTSILYPVHMIGFTPGFPYLGEVLPELVTPRHESPRLKVAKGSVGIGGKQTGIYPFETPGGWQIIGRTPLELFDIKNECTLLNSGDLVQFRAVDLITYHDIKNKLLTGCYELEVHI